MGGPWSKNVETVVFGSFNKGITKTWKEFFGVYAAVKFDSQNLPTESKNSGRKKTFFQNDFFLAIHPL